MLLLARFPHFAAAEASQSGERLPAFLHSLALIVASLLCVMSVLILRSCIITFLVAVICTFIYYCYSLLGHSGVLDERVFFDERGFFEQCCAPLPPPPLLRLQ